MSDDTNTLPSRQEFYEVINNGYVLLSADEIYDWLVDRVAEIAALRKALGENENEG
jgi:hypothetical protein